MMIIRPIAATDLGALYQLASKAGVGLTTLPANEELLKKKNQCIAGIVRG